MDKVILAAVMLFLAVPAGAETIERACLKSDRKAASRMLCGCIQDVADLTLSRSDQRRAAGFFSDPNRAQEVRQSNLRRDEIFWQNYKSFGENAKTYCS